MTKKNTSLLCLDCFIDTQVEVIAEFIIQGTTVCRVHAALRRRRMLGGGPLKRRDFRE